MQWLETFTLIMRSQVTTLREKIEDPERMIHQLILDMEEELETARKGVACALADEQQLATESERLQAEVQTWLDRASRALRQGDDSSAKSALEQKRRAEDRAQIFAEIHETQTQQTRQLEDAFRGLEDKIRQARRKQRLLLAQMALCQLHDHLEEYGVEAEESDRGYSERDRKEQLEREFEELKRRVQSEEA